ncbi:GvpL/GvpF family gas vesicle protein [Streptomyces zingiberis]|uniref:GvpL/GvpF family gas vesicle protein n=1 Tax=Streptomyces zingiberis TaxID=2053010 RepID=A0ABX1BYF8_9ACTN|nr:GvpL/GvpF family gas vesicle protein [Streptomyces zingiberis]NJQ01338.1 GvpL/GvpF family gas vesicle protein [Streptomyces zingiberis]
MSTYVYGIIDAERELPDGLAGVGDPPNPVRALRAGGLAAVVSDCPEQLRPKRRDLLAHQHVLAEAGADGAVLPLRFGSLSADDDAVLAVLTDHAEHYRSQLGELDGRVEYNVKAAHREDDVLRLVVSENDEIRALNEANRAAGGGSHQDKLRLGEMVAGAVRAREEQDAKILRDALGSAADRQAPGPESAGWLLNLSFLMGRDTAAPFVESVEELRRAHPHVDLQVTGPLPPYSFVRPAPEHVS